MDAIIFSAISVSGAFLVVLLARNATMATSIVSSSKTVPSIDASSNSIDTLPLQSESKDSSASGILQIVPEQVVEPSNIVQSFPSVNWITATMDDSDLQKKQFMERAEEIIALDVLEKPRKEVAAPIAEMRPIETLPQKEITIAPPALALPTDVSALSNATSVHAVVSEAAS